LRAEFAVGKKKSHELILMHERNLNDLNTNKILRINQLTNTHNLTFGCIIY